jgi:putative acetyltransferase
MTHDVDIQIIKVTPTNNLVHHAIVLFKAYSAEINVDLCFQNFSKELENPLEKYYYNNGVLLLAYINNTAIGCVALQQLHNEVCEMKRLYVIPQYRKHKAGYTLVREILRAAVLAGYKTIKLDTLKKLTAAIQLYEYYGFSIDNAYYENPLQEVIYMSKVLL